MRYQLREQVFLGRARQRLVRIEQRLMSWGATYQIFRGDVAIATVRKQVWSLRPKFHIELEAG
jgi:uncharacterized protein YxjI